MTDEARPRTEATHHCPMCGHAVRIVSSDEETSYMEPVEAAIPDSRLRAALEAEPQIKVEHEEDGSWSVSLRGLPGHVGGGETLEQAVAAALDAAEAWALAVLSPEGRQEPPHG